ncbi:unnamed protein product [Arabis nemorensis]|uniref:MATH domain-containing protein n=1 Tax=Arabis nemorensis TaxID=586526 RepID=A0A565C4R7_9BRAS|nr:unnamed protein product [Arabis nemorensis]
MVTAMNSNISCTTLQRWRERPPSSYSIKVKSLSQLQSSTLHSDGKCQSRRFSSGGYNWRMIIYPEGNDKDNGSGFISMYVEIDSTNLVSTQPAEVYADIRFFVFNKNENKYFTIQERYGDWRKCFRLIPSVTIKMDTSLMEIIVSFIIVAPPPTKWEITSFEEKLHRPTFSWTVENFSEIKENPYASDNFSVGGKKWCLQLYPKGYSIADTDGATLKEDEKIYVKADLKLKDPLGSNHLTESVNCWFENPTTGYGWDYYVSIAELRNTYLDKEDSLKVEIQFEVVSATEYSPFT